MNSLSARTPRTLADSPENFHLSQLDQLHFTSIDCFLLFFPFSFSFFFFPFFFFFLLLLSVRILIGHDNIFLGAQPSHSTCRLACTDRGLHHSLTARLEKLRRAALSTTFPLFHPLTSLLHRDYLPRLECSLGSDRTYRCPTPAATLVIASGIAQPCQLDFTGRTRPSSNEITAVSYITGRCSLP